MLQKSNFIVELNHSFNYFKLNLVETYHSNLYESSARVGKCISLQRKESRLLKNDKKNYVIICKI